MNRHEDDENYEDDKDIPSRRTQKTKFRELDDYENAAGFRDKRSSKRSHRQKRGKDDVWPDTDD